MVEVEVVEAERRRIISKLPDRDLQFLQVPDRLEQLHNLAQYAFHILSSYQEPNGLLQATLGRVDRVDNEDFVDGVWVKDHARAGRPGLNPYVQEYLPELRDGFTDLYISSTRGMLRVLSQPEQMERFKEARPGGTDEKGYASLADEEAPPIKFHTDGRPWEGWSKSNNQPDNWGTELLETGRGIEQRLPVLEPIPGEQAPAGMVIQRIVSYVVGLQVERLICRSIWEHAPVYSSYSTISIGAAGLRQIRKDAVWSVLVADSKKKGYTMEISQAQVKVANDSLDRKRKERSVDDYTDYHHPRPADLAPMIVLNDTNLHKAEAKQIAERVMTLKNGVGFNRFHEDPYKNGLIGASWSLGIPAMAKYDFNVAMEYYKANNFLDGNIYLFKGYDMLDVDIRLLRWFGYIPELTYDRDRNGVPVPNNNELGWGLGYLAEACGAGIAAQVKSEDLRRKLAA